MRERNEQPFRLYRSNRSSCLAIVDQFWRFSHGPAGCSRLGSCQSWLDDRSGLQQLFALAQAVPGPNMILMISFVGWKVWGIPGALASAFATFGPPCAIYFAAYRLWDRSRGAPWQHIVRIGLVPVTVGLVIGSGVVMARAADAESQAVAVTVAAAVLMLQTRINPLLMLLAGGALGGLGLL
jgi:chromate transporter